MNNYLDHLINIGDNQLSFSRKLEYFHYNFSPLLQLSSTASVMEIGPGSGAMIKFLNNQNISNIDIVDNDKAVIKHISHSFKINHAFTTSDISRISAKLQRYDLIIMIQVFEHLPKSQYSRVIKTLYKKLKKNGQIIIMVPNGGNPLNLIERYSDLQHKNAFTENSLRELPGYCGIEHAQVSVHPYQIPPSNLTNIIRIVCQKFLHLIIRILIVINGGIHQSIMTPNITLVIKKLK